MRIQLRFVIWLWLMMALAPAAAWAQAEGTAFSCDGTFYQIRQVGTTSSLFRVNRSVAAYTTAGVNIMSGSTTNNLGVLLNGLAYNPQDGYMYGLTTTGNTTTLPTSIQMYKIGQGGIQLLGTVTGMPNIQVAAGTIDKNGNYYVSSQNSTGTADYSIYRYDLKLSGAARLAATGLRLRNAGNTADLNQTFYDLALNPQDNQLYGVFQNGTLWRIDVRTNAATLQAPVTVIKATATNTDPVGTSFFDVAGNLFVYTNGVTTTANSGGFYQVNLTTGAYTFISNIDPASVSDGASCINPDQRIDIVKEVTGIVRSVTNPNQFDVTFTLRVKNTSTATATNVQVNDFLWSGSSTTVRANTTFSSTTGKLAQTVAFVGTPTVTADPTNVNPVFTLARNTAYTGIGGAPGTTTGSLLTGTQPLTAGQAAIIVFTVRVTYAATTNIPARADNQAYASSTTGANATGYSQVAASGVALSPDQLLASDLSTDGPSFPSTANDDVPTSSPIFFSTSISGTVFEDVNYGGGVGRSQASGQGVGVAGARVELYDASGAFLTFVTTDAAGNYAFSTTNGTNALANNTTYQVRVVNQSVLSNRPGSVAGLLAVQTFKNGVTNEVGGADPNKFDLAANTGAVDGTGGQTLTALRSTNSAGAVETLVSVTTPAATAFPAVLGVDFGFNFDLVVNTNASGQGSLQQFIKNSNALTNENLTQVSTVPGVTLTAGLEYAVFMMSNGTTTTNGLRAGLAAAGGYNAATGFTITPTAAFDDITDQGTAIDGKLQEALTGSVVPVAATTTGAEVTINFNALKGLFVRSGNTRIASLTLTGAKGSVTGAGGAITLSDGAAVTFSGPSVTGSVVTDVTATNNALAAIRLQRNGTTDDTNATGVTISNNILRAATTLTGTSPVYGDGINLIGASGNTISGNTISNNPGWGIVLANNTNDGNTISGNTISSNGTATGTEKSGLAIQVGSNNLVSGNTINNNVGDGIVAFNGTSGNRFTQNSFFSNGESGIDLSANAANAGDGVTINDNTDADTGANGLINFPIISQAVTSGGNLIITGYAPAGALVELFVADVQANGFGQGRTYLASWTEGSAQDGDTRTGGYSGLTSGVNQGSETATSLFMFSVPVANLTAAQQTALSTSGARLTATATLLTTVNNLVVGNTSEFSGNTGLLQNRPLPVELVQFSATADKTSAVLSWTTASEKDNARFVIERSLDGSRFETVGTVAGQGTSVRTHAYQFTDAQAAAAASLVYYRLRQEDTNGNSSYSAVRVVRFDKVASDLLVTLYPNPTASNAALDLRSLPAGTVQVRLTDLTGRVLWVAAVPTGQVYPLATAQLPQGSYLVAVHTSTAKMTRLLVKQ